MKNKFLLLGLLTLAACAEDELANPSIPQDGGNGQQEVKGIVMTGVDYQFRGNASRSQVTLGENSVKFQWKVGDQVGIFPMASDDNSEIKNEGVQVTFPMADGAGTNKAFFDGGGWALKSGYKYASYFPLVDKLLGLDKKRIPVSYDNPVYREVPSEGNVTVDLGNSDFMTAEASAADASGNINFDFRHTGALIILNAQIFCNNFTQIKRIQLTGYDPQTEKPVEFAVNGHVDLTRPMVTTEQGIKYHQFVPGTQPEDKVYVLKFDCSEAPFTPTTVASKRQIIPIYFTMAPQQLKDKMLELSIVYTSEEIGGEEFENTNCIFMLNDVEPGNAYIWNVHLSSGRGTDFYVDVPGTLSKMMGPSYGTPELDVEGTLNEADFNHIKSLTQLELISLAKVSIDGTNHFPAGVFDGMSALYLIGLPKYAKTIDPAAFKNFPNAANCMLAVYDNFADLISITDDGKYSFAGGAFLNAYCVFLNAEGEEVTGTFFDVDTSTHTITTKYDDMIYAGNITTALAEGTVLKVSGKLSDRDLKAIAAYSDAAITSLTFENVDKYVPGADVFVGFNGSEACDLVIPDAWKSLLSLVEGKLMMGGAAWKSVKDMNGKDIIAGVDPKPEIDPWSPGEGGDLETK